MLTPMKPAPPITRGRIDLLEARCPAADGSGRKPSLQPSSEDENRPDHLRPVRRSLEMRIDERTNLAALEPPLLVQAALGELCPYRGRERPPEPVRGWRPERHLFPLVRSPRKCPLEQP